MKCNIAIWVLSVFIGCLFFCSKGFGQYQFVDLGILPGGGNSYAYSINNNGQIVGLAYNSSGKARATLFDSTGAGNNIDLGTLAGGYDSWAESINNNGQIVGAAFALAGGSDHSATLFNSFGSGQNTDLVGWGESVARDINNLGIIVGQVRFNDPTRYRAAIIDPDGNHIELGVNYSEAQAINDAGQIVGNAMIAPGKWIATLFDPTGNGYNINLDPFGGKFDGYNSDARAINNDGKIVGYAMNSDGVARATIFDLTGAGKNIDLGTLPGAGGSDAFSINNNGQIVGSACGYATLFDPTGAGNNIDLNLFLPAGSGWTMSVAESINDNGWIVGEGTNPAGETRAYLLKPIPEPCTLALLTLGGFSVARRRR